MLKVALLKIALLHGCFSCFLNYTKVPNRAKGLIWAWYILHHIVRTTRKGIKRHEKTPTKAAIHIISVTSSKSTYVLWQTHQLLVEYGEFLVGSRSCLYSCRLVL